MKKIYIACALTHVPENIFNAYTQSIIEMANKLEKSGYLVKYALRDSDPQLTEYPENKKAELCYQWDKEMVLWADVIIAECSFPSIGLGIELEIASSANKKTIVLYNKDDLHKATPKSYDLGNQSLHELQIGAGHVSLMALGLPNIASVIPYSDLNALAPLVLENLE